MKFSIIVPVYNSEQYIEKCLDSLLNQTYSNYEVICVDDGSKDNSLKILREIEKNNPRLKVIHQNNSGCVIARKNGVRKSSGEYCLFVDSDDWIDYDALNILYKYINMYNDVDILKFAIRYEPSGKIMQQYDMINHLLSDEEIYQIKKELITNSKYNNLANQVFKKKLFDIDNQAFQNKINQGEDLIINLELFNKSKKIVLINEPLYHYYINESSITRDNSIENLSKLINDNIYVNKERIKYAEIFNIKDIDLNLYKNKVVSFVFDKIKNYIYNNSHPDFELFQKELNNSDFYDFVINVKITDKNFFSKMFKKRIVSKNIIKIKRFIVLFKMKKIINNIK